MINKLDPVSLGILWDRLISITDEMQVALVRVAFSTVVTESYDLSCQLFAPDGDSLVQAGTYALPSFTGTGPATVKHMLHKFHLDTLKPGDVVITNDPWLGTGHLYDINVMRPVFRGVQLVGYTLSVTHLSDAGGRGFSASSTEVYEEGLRLPICKLVEAGKLNESLLELIRTNVRVSEQVVGDLMANVTCNEVGERLLLEFMDEYGIDDLTPLSKAIIGTSESAMRKKIREMPDDVYENKIKVETMEKPVTLACQVKISGDRMHISFDGTDPVVRGGINVPLCYTRAYAAYAVKCVTTPTIPNNEGSLTPITFSVPEGCILNAKPPCPTAGRHVIGHFVTPLVFGALGKAVPELVQADCGMVDLLNFQGTHRDGKSVSTIYFGTGGFGALNDIDGAPTTPGPANMTGTPIEVWEDRTSTTIVKKALLTDSGGPGKYRGGLGQELVFRNDTGHLMTVSSFAGRNKFPALGMNGGKPAQLRKYWVNGKEIRPTSRYMLKPGDEIKIHAAGGGGYGNPNKRSVEKVLEDVVNGFVSVEGALRDYGVDVNSTSLGARRVLV